MNVMAPVIIATAMQGVTILMVRSTARVSLAFPEMELIVKVSIILFYKKNKGFERKLSGLSKHIIRLHTP
jgi:hypothetical protein